MFWQYLLSPVTLDRHCDTEIFAPRRLTRWSPGMGVHTLHRYEMLRGVLWLCKEFAEPAGSYLRAMGSMQVPVGKCLAALETLVRSAMKLHCGSFFDPR